MGTLARNGLRYWFETLEITYLHEVICSKVKKNPDSVPGVAKRDTLAYPLIFEKKIVLNTITQQGHFKIYGSFEFQDTGQFENFKNSKPRVRFYWFL